MYQLMNKLAQVFQDVEINEFSLARMRGMIDDHYRKLAQLYEAKPKYKITFEDNKIIVTPENVHAVLLLLYRGHLIRKYRIPAELTEFECDEFWVKDNMYSLPCEHIQITIGIASVRT